MPINYAQLKTEINTDPAGLGYAPMIAQGNDQGIADALNLVRSGNTYLVSRGILPAYEIWEAIVPAEWAALNATERSRIQSILSMGQINPEGANTKGSFSAAFASGTTTRANLLALSQRQGSRAEVLFGTGTYVTHTDVAIALRQT